MTDRSNRFSHILHLLDNDDKVIETLERVHTRKLDRLVAKDRMRKRRGMTKICKHDYSGQGHRKTRNPSAFAEKWRDYAI